MLACMHEVAQLICYCMKNGTCSIRTDMPCMSKQLLSTACSRRRDSPEQLWLALPVHIYRFFAEKIMVP